MCKRSLNGIKNVIFDLDGTLIHRKPNRAIYIQEYLLEKGFRISEHQRKEAGRWSSRFWFENGLWQADSNWDEKENRLLFWQSYLDEYHDILKVPPGSLNTMFSELAEILESDEAETFIYDDTNGVLDDLRARGYKMGVLSNRESRIKPVVDDFGLAAYFDCAYSAGELGSEKPSKAIFEKFLGLFGGKPSETVYVGDNYWLDGIGSKNAGMKPVIFDEFNWYDEIGMLKISTMSELLYHL